LPITVFAELAADAPLVAPASSGIAARAIVATAAAISRLVLALRLAVAGLDGSARGRARTAVKRVDLSGIDVSFGTSPGHELARP
jgi:hypothetical protein